MIRQEHDDLLQEISSCAKRAPVSRIIVRDDFKWPKCSSSLHKALAKA